MDFDDAIYRAFRKGRLRVEILLRLLAYGEMHLDMLAEHCRAERKLVLWALHGNPPKFKVELAPVPLGLVRWTAAPTGRVLQLTPRGQLYAARLAEGWRP